MAVAFVQVLAEGQEKVNDATLTLSAIGSPSVTVGNKIFVALCTDAQAGTNVSTITDNLGNAYEESSASRQLTDFIVMCWFAPITVGGALTSISVTLTNSNTAKAGVAGEYSGVGTWASIEDAETFSASTTVQATNSGSANYDLKEGQLLVGVLGTEGPGTDTYTGDASGSPSRTTTLRREIGTTGGGPTSNVRVALADIIADANITDHKLPATISTSRDAIGSASVFDAIPAVAPLGTPLLMGRVHSFGPPLLRVQEFPASIEPLTFNQALTATATTTAAIVNSVGKLLSASVTSSASILKSVGKTLSATASSTASIVKSAGKLMNATATTTATITNSVSKALTATVTSTASIVADYVALIIPPLAPLLMQLRLRPFGPPVLAPLAPLPPPPSGTIFNQALSATVTATAAIVNAVGKLLSATVTTTASIVRSTGKLLSATATSTASIVQSVGKPLLATSTSTATIVRSSGKTLSATATSTATMVRNVGKVLSATVTSTATLVNSVGKVLSATVTSTAAIIADYLALVIPPLAPLLIKLRLRPFGPPLLPPLAPLPPPPAGALFNQALTATVTTTAAIVRSIGKVLSATATSTASIVKQVGKTLSATATSTATIARSAGKALSATVTASASIVKQVAIRLTTTATATASMFLDPFIASAVIVVRHFRNRLRGRMSSKPAESDFDPPDPSGKVD